jgi:hypothetical protein
MVRHIVKPYWLSMGRMPGWGIGGGYSFVEFFIYGMVLFMEVWYGN